MLAIRVKYVGATNYRPSRLIASINGPNGKTRSVSVSWNAAEDAAGTTSNSAAVYAQAAKALMRKFGLVGELVGGELPDGSQAFVFTKTGAGLEIANTRHKNPRPRVGAKKENFEVAINDLNTAKTISELKQKFEKWYKRYNGDISAQWAISEKTVYMREQIEKRPLYKNPRPRIGSKKPLRASSATGKRPTKRLVSRRKSNTRKGYFPNPRKAATYYIYSPLSGILLDTVVGAKAAAKRAGKDFYYVDAANSKIIKDTYRGRSVNIVASIPQQNTAPQKGYFPNPALPVIPGVHIESVKDYKGRDFSQGAFFVASDHSGPGWFIWGRSFDEYAPQGIIRKMAWPDKPARRYANYNGKVNAGFTTKKAAQAIADILNSDNYMPQTPAGFDDSAALIAGDIRPYSRNPTVTKISGFYDEKGNLARVGLKVKDFRGDAATVKGFEPPHKPESEGFITTNLGRHYAGVYGFKWQGPRPYSRNPTRRAIRQGIRFYRKHAGKWLMFDPAVYAAKTKSDAIKIAGNLAKMFKTQIKVVLQK